jgi:hypothetical protein
MRFRSLTASAFLAACAHRKASLWATMFASMEEPGPVRSQRTQKRILRGNLDASPALIPLHDGEVFLPVMEVPVAPGTAHIAGAAVKNEKSGIASILTANRNPLIDTANFYVRRFIDGIRASHGILLRRSLLEEIEPTHEFVQIFRRDG